MRSASAAAIVLLVLAVTAVSALAADPLRGTVKKSFTANGEYGHISTSFTTSTPTVYASFVWLRAPTAGQRLEIDWFGPSGQRVAEWTNKTLATDTKGTRIYSYIRKGSLATRPGRWRVAISVGGVERATMRFTIAKA